MNIWHILRKEVIDNLRDRQSFFYALLFGPVLLPLLIGGSLVGSLKQIAIDFDHVSELPVVNADAAPNLMAFLRGQNLDAVAAPSNVDRALRTGSVLVVLEVPDDFGDALRAGTPAPLIVHLNDARKDSTKAARKLGSLLGVYDNVLNTLRMQHRGINPTVFQSLEITEHDVSEDGVNGQLIASILPFLLIISMVMGGFYLAIDTTAGERERQSLEPLLSLPVARRQLVFGKFGATLCFVTLSGALTALSLYLVFRLFPSELMGGQLSFDGATMLRAFLLALPLALFISALLITVSAFTRSTKEAQTYLGLLMVIPIAPFFVLQFVSVTSSWAMMPLPMISQYLLLERVVLQDPLQTVHVVLSVLGTVLGAGLLLWQACRLYQRERILH